MAAPNADKNEAVEAVKAAMLATDLDVVLWHEDALDELARAAIKGLRLPTEAMKDALQSYALCTGYLEEGWAAAIDEAAK